MRDQRELQFYSQHMLLSLQGKGFTAGVMTWVCQDERIQDKVRLDFVKYEISDDFVLWVLCCCIYLLVKFRCGCIRGTFDCLCG
jgi:hypothetical protein